MGAGAARADGPEAQIAATDRLVYSLCHDDTRVIERAAAPGVTAVSES